MFWVWNGSGCVCVCVRVNEWHFLARLNLNDFDTLADRLSEFARRSENNGLWNATDALGLLCRLIIEFGNVQRSFKFTPAIKCDAWEHRIGSSVVRGENPNNLLGRLRKRHTDKGRT